MMIGLRFVAGSDADVAMETALISVVLPVGVRRSDDLGTPVRRAMRHLPWRRGTLPQ